MAPPLPPPGVPGFAGFAPVPIARLPVEQAVEDRPRHADAGDGAAVRALVAPVAGPTEGAADDEDREAVVLREDLDRGAADVRPGRGAAVAVELAVDHAEPPAADEDRAAAVHRLGARGLAVGEDEALHGQDGVGLVLAVVRRPDLRLVARVLVQDPAGALSVERDEAAPVEDDIGLVVEDLGGHGHRDRDRVRAAGERDDPALGHGRCDRRTGAARRGAGPDDMVGMRGVHGLGFRWDRSAATGVARRRGRRGDRRCGP